MDLFVLVLCVLLTANSCSADKVVRTGLQMARGSQSVTVRPWLVGLTAVVVFLLIVFVILIANRLFRKKRSNEDGWDYEKAIELDGGDTKQTSL